ncbi:MAG: GNAT family N-acetyltransferase, partial [Acetobacteraceae bacterium]
LRSDRAMSDPTLDFVTLAERPDLIVAVRSWLAGRHASPAAPERCFVLLAGGIPAGTASLTARGLASRPDLTPWLANLFVPPALRGRGHAARLVARVEAAAWVARIPALWLVTRSARGLYARLGWQEIGPADYYGEPAILMRRDRRPAREETLQNPKPYTAESAAT